MVDLVSKHDVGRVGGKAAIIARELGVPAVGTGAATSRIRTGDRLRLGPIEQTVTLLG